jgi:hypothetical protein
MKTEIGQAQSPHNAMRSTGKKYQKSYRVFLKSARLGKTDNKKGLDVFQFFMETDH